MLKATIILLFAAIIGVSYMYTYHYGASTTVSSVGFGDAAVHPRLAHSVEDVPVLKRKESRTPPEGSKAYRNEFLWMQLFYPEHMTVEEVQEKEGARTIVFHDAERGHELQIFAVPYAEDHITEERFRLDNELGVVGEQRELRVDGELATAFYSSNKFVGETYEVWVISRGFLYEVSAHRALKDLLDDIVSTWEWL